MKRILWGLFVPVIAAAALCVPAAGREGLSWQELMDLAAKGAWQYSEEHPAYIFEYSMLDINRDGIPELLLTPMGGNRGTAHPVLSYIDGEYRYLCEVHLAYNWSLYYIQSGDELSLVVDHGGGPATETIHRVTRLTLRDEGIYMKDYRYAQLWHIDPSTGEWTMYSAYSEFKEWLSVDQEGLWDQVDMLTHKPEDEDRLYRQWFEEGRLPDAVPYASVAVEDIAPAGESVSGQERIRLLIHQLGNRYQAGLNGNPDTGK